MVTAKMNLQRALEGILHIKIKKDKHIHEATAKSKPY